MLDYIVLHDTHNLHQLKKASPLRRSSPALKVKLNIM